MNCVLRLLFSAITAVILLGTLILIVKGLETCHCDVCWESTHE